MPSLVIPCHGILLLWALHGIAKRDQAATQVLGGHWDEFGPEKQDQRENLPQFYLILVPDPINFPLILPIPQAIHYGMHVTLMLKNVNTRTGLIYDIFNLHCSK